MDSQPKNIIIYHFIAKILVHPQTQPTIENQNKINTRELVQLSSSTNHRGNQETLHLDC